jgi:hypothetical protein
LDAKGHREMPSEQVEKLIFAVWWIDETRQARSITASCRQKLDLSQKLFLCGDEAPVSATAGTQAQLRMRKEGF